MAFPSSIGTKATDLIRAWDAMRSFAGEVKSSSQQLRDTSAATTIGANLIITYLRELVAARSVLVTIAATPGLEAYARSQISDPTLDLAASWTAMRNAIDSTITWIRTNFPKDGSGYLLYETLDANGVLQIRTLTPATTAGLRTTLDALIATID